MDKITIGSRVQLTALSEDLAARGFAIGDSGVVLPQYIPDLADASVIWTDGTVLVRRDDGALFNAPPTHLAVDAA